MNPLPFKHLPFKDKIQSLGEWKPFTFLGLAEAEDPNRWDIVVSAPWISEDNRDGMRVVLDRLRELLSPPELRRIARIVPLDEGHPFLVDIRKIMPDAERNPIELTGETIDGVLFNRVYVFVSA